MKILAVIPGKRDPKGVSFVHALREVEAIRALGVEVAIYDMDLRRNPWRMFPEWFRLRRVIASVQPDLVHAHVGGPVGLLTTLASDRPTVVTYRGSELNPCPQMNRFHWAVHWLCSQLAARRARGLVCVSKELEGRLISVTCPLRVLPSGVDTDDFFPRDRQESRRRLGWGPDERVVIFNASLSPEVKRIDRARAAMAILPGNVRLEVMSGQVAPREVPWLLSAADCLLVTSDLEGSPAIVQEAIACALPVVTVPVGDVAELLTEVEPSWIVPPEPRLLAEALAQALDYRGRSNGPAKASSLSCHHNAQELVNFYQGLL